MAGRNGSPSGFFCKLMPTRILDPVEIEQLSASEIPFLRLPDRICLFSERGARLRKLAPDHPMGDYLLLIAAIAETQQWLLENMPPVNLPKPEQIRLCKEHGMPPLNSNSYHRDRMWCDLLRRMLRRLADETEGEVRKIIMRLEGARDEFYEAQASKLLAAITFGLDTATAPLLGSALQVYWVHMATALGLQSFGRIDAPNVCPVCGSRPVASIVRIGAQESGHRYLHCSLCSAEWHMVRIKCSNCETTKGIHYWGIEGGSKAIQAESCDACGTYLKIFYMERDNQVEPTADDVASIQLDLLVSEKSKLRSGGNFMLIHGEAGD